MAKRSDPRAQTQTPHLIPLAKVSAEIGVSRDTIKRNPAAFFPTVRFGRQHFVASAAYAAWRDRLASTVGLTP